MPAPIRLPVLSVVIASRGRTFPSGTLDGLSSAAAVSEGAVEVVWVFDGVPARDPEDRRANGFGFEFRPLALVRSGLPAARNAGWKFAVSDLVLFIDEDVIASPSLLRAHVEAHCAHPGCLVLGRVVEISEPLTAWGEHEQVAADRRWRRLDNESRLGPIRVSMSNASISRKHLEETGGFAGWMPSEDDIELGFRLQALGVPIVSAPDAVGERRSRRTFEEWCSLARVRGKLDVSIYRNESSQSGGAASLAAAFRERHPFNRAAIRVASRSQGLERSMLATAARIGVAAHGAGLKRLSRAALSLVANIEYWAGVRQGLRGRDSFQRLLASAGRGS